MKRIRLGMVLVLGLAVVALGLGFAPYVYTEMMPVLARHGWPIAPASGIRNEALSGPGQL